jgi:hypothetical protein
MPEASFFCGGYLFESFFQNDSMEVMFFEFRFLNFTLVRFQFTALKFSFVVTNIFLVSHNF